MYTANDVEDFYSAWRSHYRENDVRGESCKTFVYGDQWDGGIAQERALRGEESFVFNVTQKQLLRVKGEAESLELGLQITANNNTVDPMLLQEGREILDKLILCNDHLSAFQEALNQVYDHGYGALLVTTKLYKEGEPSEIPFLRVIKDLKKAFWDPECEDDFKTEGRYCGIRYTVDQEELFPGKYHKKEKEKEKEYDVIDFWYREKSLVDWYYTESGNWTKEEQKKFLAHKKIPNYQVKFMRIIDGEIHEGPIDYYTHSKLPLVYWKGYETLLKRGSISHTKTLPFAFNLVDTQSFTNYVGSAIVSRLKKLGGTKVVVTDQMIEGKENFWSDFNRRTGVLQVNESEEGLIQQPIILPPEQLDGTLLNAFQTAMQLMDLLSGITAAQSGEQAAPTNAGLHRQIMQSNILQNVVLGNHLRAINEVGRVLKEMIPQVIIEERDIGGGFVVNKKGAMNTPSSPQIINNIKELFSRLDFEISYGASSDAEKAANLIAIKEILSTNPQIAPYFADEFAENLNTANSEVLKRRMQALMPQGIKEVGDGTMSLDEYRQQQQQQAEEQQQQSQQQPNLQQQQLELQKQKVIGDQQLRQEEINIKKVKLQEQVAKDTKNLQIKEVSALEKLKKKQP